jgi:hypothetical protein
MTYLYKPPTWRNAASLAGSLVYGITTSTIVYRQAGIWINIQSAGFDAPKMSDVDVEPRTHLLLFFDRPSIVPDEVQPGLAALQPADPSWTPGSLVLL